MYLFRVPCFICFNTHILNSGFTEKPERLRSLMPLFDDDDDEADYDNIERSSVPLALWH